MKISVALGILLTFSACHRSTPTAIEADPITSPPSGSEPARAGVAGSPESSAPSASSAPASAAPAVSAEAGTGDAVSQWYARLDNPDPKAQIEALRSLLQADAATLQSLRERLRSYAYDQDAAAPIVALSATALSKLGNTPPANAGPALLQYFVTESDPQLATAETEALVALARVDSDTREGLVTRWLAAPSGPPQERLTAGLLQLGSVALPDLHAQLDHLPADSAQRAPLEALIHKMEQR